MYPKSEYLINYVENNININSTINNMVKNKENEYSFKNVLNRIIDEFNVKHPKLYMEYFGWCSYHKCNLPKQDIFDIMLINNTNEKTNNLPKLKFPLITIGRILFCVNVVHGN